MILKASHLQQNSQQNYTVITLCAKYLITDVFWISSQTHPEIFTIQVSYSNIYTNWNFWPYCTFISKTFPTHVSYCFNILHKLDHGISQQKIAEGKLFNSHFKQLNIENSENIQRNHMSCSHIVGTNERSNFINPNLISNDDRFILMRTLL